MQMDQAVRMLREGPADGGPAPLLLWQAQAMAPAPLVMLLKAIEALAAAIACGTAHATGLTVLALQQPPAIYQRLCEAAALEPAAFRVVDVFTDPYGWWQGQPQSEEQLQQHCNSAISPAAGVLAPAASAPLTALQQQLASAAGHCIVFDALTPLLDTHGSSSVASMLQALRMAGSEQGQGPSSLLCSLDGEAHSQQELALLSSVASGVVQLLPGPQQRPSSGSSSFSSSLVAEQLVHGRLSVRLKRRMGRIRAAAEVYAVSSSGQVSLAADGATAAAPSSAAGPGAAPAAASAAPAAGNISVGNTKESVDALQQRMGTGMKLTLTEEELAARQRVQLPYELSGRLPAHQEAGGDFRDVLPAEAGGAAGPGHSLGRILYTRDSESEADSDDLVDDDLEI